MAESKEAVALELLRAIAYGEAKGLPGQGAPDRADRTWILETYALCLAAVEGRKP